MIKATAAQGRHNTPRSQAEALLELDEPASEADLNTYRRHLSEAAEALQPGASQGLLDYQRLLARLADRRADALTASEQWQLLRTSLAQALDEAHFGLGQTALKLGRPEEAEQFLAAVSSTYADQDGLAKARNQVARSLADRRTIAAAAKVLDSTTHNDISVGHAALDDALGLTRLNHLRQPAISQALHEALDSVSGLPVGRRSATRDPYQNYRRVRRQQATAEGSPPGVILPSGFLWSGSGAVTALLEGLPEVEVAIGGRELGLFHYMDTYPGVFDRSEEYISPRSLLTIILSQVAGLYWGGATSRIRLNQEKSLLKAQFDAGGPLEPIIAAISSLTSSLRTIDRSRDEDHAHGGVLEALATFANGALYALRPETSTTILCNNSVFAFHIRLMSILDDARAVTVKRDPRDQYVAQFYERPRQNLPPVETFITDTRRRLRQHDEAIRELALQDRVIAIKFEDFVRDEHLRRDIIERLGFQRGIEQALHAYDASRSQRNVGIHRKFPDPGIIRVIEQEMADYISL